MAESAELGRVIFENGPVRLKVCRHGPMLYLCSDQYIGRSLDQYGEFSQGEVDLFSQLVRPGMVVLDVGAHLGVHTIFFAKATGPTGQVYAFEPQRALFHLLSANVILNALGNVLTQQAAVGREAGTLIVPALDYSATNNFGGLALGQYNRGYPVPVVTVDSLYLAACHLMKIDVEGMEGEVLAGAQETIRRFHPVLYVENDRQEKSAALIAQLLGMDYRLYWHLPPLFNTNNFFGVRENVIGSFVSINMLALPKAVPQDIRGLKEITSPEDTFR